MMKARRPEVEDEWYAVRHSGEIPEIALHSALHYLSEAEDGPRLTLGRQEIRHLQQAAALRFREIVLRDMLWENLGKPIARGLGRSVLNFRRYENFLARLGLTDRRFRHQAAITLVIFLVREWSARRHGAIAHDPGFVVEELLAFAETLAVPVAPFALCLAEMLALDPDKKNLPGVLP
ncbi:MAG: hypothetical protein LBH14_01855 [Desulfobulbaceae bacterium]|jgi:hypothetical protein|nr:hypothetical protein [Desulfobulbaceae bacterium]